MSKKFQIKNLKFKILSGLKKLTLSGELIYIAKDHNDKVCLWKNNMNWLICIAVVILIVCLLAAYLWLDRQIRQIRAFMDPQLRSPGQRGAPITVIANPCVLI